MTDNGGKPYFDCAQFFVTSWPKTPKTPWKLEVRVSFAGSKVRRFFSDPGAAVTAGHELVSQIRSSGTQSLKAAGMTVKEATEKFLPRVEGLSYSHRQKSELYCRILKENFGSTKLQFVTAEALDNLMRTKAPDLSTRAVFFRYFRMFFRWAHRFGHIDRNPMMALDCPPTRALKNILTPDQLKGILDLEMPLWLRNSVLLGAFAGLRSEEMMRMEWKDVDTKTGQIHVRPEAQKDSGGYDERIVDFTAPLTRRKAELKGEGLIIPMKSKPLANERNKYITNVLEWPEWPRNWQRHSFATYHLAKCKNPGLTAFQMGHTSPAMVQRVYAVPAKKADWKAWWAI